MGNTDQHRPPAVHEIPRCFRCDICHSVPLSSLLYISAGTISRFLRGVYWALGNSSGEPVIRRQYFTHQAATLLMFAQSTTCPQLAAVLTVKAADLKSQLDERARGRTSVLWRRMSSRKAAL